VRAAGDLVEAPMPRDPDPASTAPAASTHITAAIGKRIRSFPLIHHNRRMA
jgi:hypothetical protein